ncbi:hypothetical protein QYE76_039870 [Lolium multiflorum]|uniref:Uncharacterized protein n=1 Tax=Lolium multiflorum TaxID=4521 RepID=A0AAD8WS67_LOLMU|nr:hypothetical protein QYE76_039870 [Lolium multiflorum]
MENYSLLMGAAAVMKMAVEMAAVSREMAVVSMEKPSGHFPAPAGAEIPVPDLGFAMTAARKERDEPHSYRYSPEPRWRTTPPHGSSGDVMKMEMAAVSMEMAVVSMEKPSGHFPVRRVRNRDSCPRSWLRDDGGWKVFVGLVVRLGFSIQGFI